MKSIRTEMMRQSIIATDEEQELAGEVAEEVLQLLKERQLSRFLAVQVLELTKAAMDEEPIR